MVICRIKTTFGLHKMSGCKDDTYRNHVHVLQCQTLCSSRNSKIQLACSVLIQTAAYKTVPQQSSAVVVFKFSQKRLIFSFMFIWYTMNWATVDQDTLTI